MNYEKYSSGQRQILRHIDRTKKVNYSNTNVKINRTADNVRLSPDRPESAYKYWIDSLNKSNLHITRRSGVNATVDLVCFCVSLPSELETAQKDTQIEFFRTTYDFILHFHFGEKSEETEQWVVTAIVHYDEITDSSASTPHLHTAIIPACRTDKYTENGWKCSARDFMTKKDLYHWHDDYQSWIDERFNSVYGLNVKVKTGTTTGRNYSIDYYKAHRREIQNERTREIARQREKEQPIGWGTNSGWGRREWDRDRTL